MGLPKCVTLINSAKLVINKAVNVSGIKRSELAKLINCSKPNNAPINGMAKVPNAACANKVNNTKGKT